MRQWWPWAPHFLGFTITDTPHSVGLIWTSDQPVAETSTLPTHENTQETSMFWVGFKPTIPDSEKLQTHALDRAVTGIGRQHLHMYLYHAQTSHSSKSACVAVIVQFLRQYTYVNTHYWTWDLVRGL
jgi:hypothetical protein